MGQDEFIFAMYFLASGLMFMAAFMSGELLTGANFLLNSETMRRTLNPDGAQTPDEKVYRSGTKIACLTLFVIFGYLGSSCAGAITKHFGALSMSITSTARKAVTLFLSFALFPKACSFLHLVGMTTFVGALALKAVVSQRANRKKDAMEPKHEREPMTAAERNL